MKTTKLLIETNRLLIRKYDDKDVTDILEYSLDADFGLSRYINWKPTKESIKEYYEPMKKSNLESYPKWLDLVIELKTEKKVVGCTGIGFANEEQKQAMVGCALGCKYQEQGIASEALKGLISFGLGYMKLHRIYARTGSLNIPSWSLMERIGM